ncbi:hypothetical protein Aple_031850 [Acrocarpospora pleiomorpha]|uniref:Integrase catalytic domain-containing protein n=1 Tax=Acrocarpospora pleiomorpha TaxID=90975 RepID=A0A5M3XJ96_9ACTN|nr:DDE-type integrase/transposase/recombinase [Acrocarpospora pleiomorpha]GES20289.1 hypothetical protein Aple_031850 [Acrocarpospora pleiomorpha]
MQRRFDVAGPDELWLTDITENPSSEGKVYCAAIMDAYSRPTIQDTNLVVGALTMAVTRRNPGRQSEILHSDYVAQYTSWAFGKRLREARLLGSMGTVGDWLDNAMKESFWGNDAARTSRHPGPGKLGNNLPMPFLNESSAGIIHTDAVPVSECKAPPRLKASTGRQTSPSDLTDGVRATGEPHRRRHL